jgi:hypothetical protein
MSIASATSTPLRSELLSFSQMPTGWSVVSGGTSFDAKRTDCADASGRLMWTQPVARASVGFQYGGYLPALVEALARQHNASGVFARMVSVCRTGQMSFPKLGDASAAFVVHGSGYTAYLLLARKGGTLMALEEAGSPLFGGLPSVSQFEHFAKLAASMLH